MYEVCALELETEGTNAQNLADNLTPVHMEAHRFYLNNITFVRMTSGASIVTNAQNWWPKAKYEIIAERLRPYPPCGFCR
eukprot:1690762-Karenia_brevis.AAC.2